MPNAYSVPGNSVSKTKSLTRIPQGDIRVECHGAVILLCPLTKTGRDWIETNIGGENGIQPYYHRGRVIAMETRYEAEVVANIHRDRLVTR